MKATLENKTLHLDNDSWPMMLTPELREQLLQAKMARALQYAEHSKKWIRFHNPDHQELCDTLGNVSTG